jgi:hypothetical protein
VSRSSNNVHVMFDKGQNRWVGKCENSHDIVAQATTQKAAFEQARSFEQVVGGEVVIHRKDGNAIREKNTYGKPDEFPPRG